VSAARSALGEAAFAAAWAAGRHMSLEEAVSCALGRVAGRAESDGGSRS
jgi:hypothetical protein